MAERRSKTENKYGTYHDIPKKYTCKKARARKKYVYISEEKKHYNIIAYSCADISKHFNIKRDIIQRNARNVEKFNDEAVLNLCTHD